MAYPGSTQPGEYCFDQLALGGYNNADSHWNQASQLEYPKARIFSKSGTRMNVVIHAEARDQYRTTQSDPSFDPRSPASKFSPDSNQAPRGYPSQINTNFTCNSTQADLSPLPLTSPAAPGQIYTGGYRNVGSTPSLSSSMSSPPTGKSANLLLTPDSALLPGSRLPGTPDDFDSTNLRSPAQRGTGNTPELGVLTLDDFSFQLAPTAKAQGAYHSQQSSVLLSSNDGLESSQTTDLEPLDDTFTNLGQLNKQEPVADNAAIHDDGGYNITIDSVPATVHNIPVTVALEPQFFDANLSPLTQLQALPMEHQMGGAGYVGQMPGVIFQPTSWDANGGLQSYSPIHTHSIQVDGRPPAPLATLSPFFFPGDDDRQAIGSRGFHNSKSPASTVQDALQAGHAGHGVVNPKGVSERTLAAAKANRKREAKFLCEVCGNSQTSKQNLQNHIASRHFQLKRFVCPFPGCLAKYGHARGVNRHLDSKHPGFRQAASKGKRGPPKRT